ISGGAFGTVAVGVFLTPELWGVGNSGPWLHDGRAGTLEEAISLHGVASPPPPGDPGRSEAQDSRDLFEAFSAGDKVDLVTFLRSLILFELPEAEGE
ncbi:MAG TPA: di-heme oxidoredictase family protein, partial [Planctomycetota bacterium]|nr:di-heme oxidoredictase family protein [Planctomycetota bacterium]